MWARCALGARPHLGATQSHLGATRPRVGICLTRLDALASKYKNTFPLIIVLSSWGIEPQLDNADAGTRRPQVRLLAPQVRTRCLLVRTRRLHTYIYYLEILIDFSALHAPFKEIDMVNCTLE
jgi:hypothetical protein